jgi:hypothetical protein
MFPGMMMSLWTKNAVFPGCSSLLALTYSSLAAAQKFITLRPFMISMSVNTRLKDKKLLYNFHAYAQT